MLLKQDFVYTPKGKNRPLHIYLPDRIEPGEQLPVMYFFDGHNLFRVANAGGLRIFCPAGIEK